MIIRDLINPVVGKLRQRTDMVGVLPYYIAQALLDLSENIEFEALKVTGPQTNFEPNQSEYSLKGNPFTASDEHRITFIQSWFVYFSQDGTINSGQTTGKEIDKRDLRTVEPMSKIPGIPSVYVIFGDKRKDGKLIVGQMPDSPYPTQMRYQRQHPFNIPYSDVLQAQSDTSLATKLAQSEVLIDDDWTDIVVYFAAEKACDDIGLNEIGMQYHQKLFGYKDKKGNDFPGLITVKQTQQERQSIFNSRALRPYVRRYTG